MFELRPVRADDESAVLAFELANRAYFGESISDRGDDFFEHFAERHRALLAEQEAGVSVFHVLVDEVGTVVGRFNLYDLVDRTAAVGYRVAQQVAGRGVATCALRELCRMAGERYGLRTLRAGTDNDNLASQRVLTKVGFVSTGPADPADVGGRSGSCYELVLASGVDNVDNVDNVPKRRLKRAGLG